MTLSLFLLVPTITYFSYKATQGTPQRTELDYSKRGQWFMQAVKSRPLKYDKFVAGETGKLYKKTDLHIDPDVENILQLCVRWAQDEEFINNTKTVDALEQFSEDPANGFYPPYLLATWHNLNGNQAEHDRWMKIAFDRADTAIVQRLINDEHQPVVEYALPPVAIGYDRVTDGKLNNSLVLIYPRPTSQANGFVYLPVYRSVYRLTDAGLPLGVDPGLHPTQLTLLPQKSTGTDPNWFSVPDGAVGRLDDAVLTEDEISYRTLMGYMRDYKRAMEQNESGDSASPDQPE